MNWSRFRLRFFNVISQTSNFTPRFETGVELVLHALRQIGSGGGFGLGEVGRGVLLHPLQRGLLGAVTFVVDGGAIGRPVRLPVDGLHALLPRL